MFPCHITDERDFAVGIISSQLLRIKGPVGRVGLAPPSLLATGFCADIRDLFQIVRSAVEPWKKNVTYCIGVGTLLLDLSERFLCRM